jgi:hypothetical protein
MQRQKWGQDLSALHGERKSKQYSVITHRFSHAPLSTFYALDHPFPTAYNRKRFSSIHRKGDPICL